LFSTNCGAKGGKLGRAPYLLYVDPERAEEFEGIGPQRRAASIDPARSAQTQLVADRPIHEYLAEGQTEPDEGRWFLNLTFVPRGLLGERSEELEYLALERRRIRRPHPQLGQHVLPDPRRRQRDRRAELTQVALYRIGSFRTIAGEADEQGQHHRKERVTYPRHRQVAQHLVADANILRLDKGLRGAQ